MDSKQKLLNDLRKEIKKANQRILRLERLTEIEKPFATKQLYDYLDTFAITEKGRVKANMKMTVNELKLVQKAVKQFIKNDLSKASKVKKYKEELENKTGEDITYKQADTMYKARKYWDWILDYFPGSEFFAYFVWPARDNNWSEGKWLENIKSALGTNKRSSKLKKSKIADKDLEQDLIDLYNYFVRDYKGR